MDASTMEKQMEAMEKRILEAFKIYCEDLRIAIQKGAEGFGATLQSIERKLDETNRHWAAKWELHEDVLKSHADNRVNPPIDNAVTSVTPAVHRRDVGRSWVTRVKPSCVAVGSASYL